MGEALEYYVKDLFCDCLREKSVDEKDKVYSKYFSYIGNQNNPPDLIISKGDAVEVNVPAQISIATFAELNVPVQNLIVTFPKLNMYRNWSLKAVLPN